MNFFDREKHHNIRHLFVGDITFNVKYYLDRPKGNHLSQISCFGLFFFFFFFFEHVQKTSSPIIPVKLASLSVGVEYLEKNPKILKVEEMILHNAPRPMISYL